MNALPELTVGPATRLSHITVLPIYAPAQPFGVEYRLGRDALADGALEIHELGAHGRVDTLGARNHGGDRVLFVEGDHLTGIKQNRVVTSSAMIGGKARLELPVACVERGRWTASSASARAAASTASSNVRRAVKLTVTQSLVRGGGRGADQSRVWSEIADQQRRLRVTSSTSAMSDTFSSRAYIVARGSARLPCPPDAAGLAIGVDGEVVSIDIFDKPSTCAHYWRQLIEAALVEADATRSAGSVTPADVHAMVAGLRAASWVRVPPVGLGEELRVATREASASMLIVDGRVVHFGAAAAARALSSTPHAVRRDLPSPLATRYRIVERIGVGSSKEVFRAVALDGGFDVAIARVPRIDAGAFHEEVALLRRVDSAHVARIHDAFVDDGDGYLVMEYCNGPTLAMVAGDRGLAAGDAGPILLAFARGLRAIHAAHVLHRDIKPDNAVLCATPDGPRLKLLDFGLAVRSRSDSTAVGVLRDASGTLPYMPPEVLRGRRLDARADVYAFGVSCYRILVGAVPMAPGDGEHELAYMQRLASVVEHDLSPLPALPAAARDAIARMLEPDASRRPFMPEVVEAFERAFGAAPSIAPGVGRAPARPLALTHAAAIAIPIASPEHVIVAACERVPVVVLEPGATTSRLVALGGDGAVRWSRELDAAVVTGLRADLDGDGARELYVAGPHAVVALDLDGRVRWTAPRTTGGPPSLVAIHDRERPRLAVDGRVLSPRTGEDTGALPFVYEGDGQRLIEARDRRGVAYHGHALQAFRGPHGTAVAIVSHPGSDRFVVAQLEQPARGRRVELAVYGPGGARLHGLVVAHCDVGTGDAAQISRLVDDPPLFGPEHAPIALLGARDGEAVVIAPLVGADRSLPPCLAAFALPSGRELWRRRLDGATTGRALLADLRGDGHPLVVVGTGTALVAFDPWTGEPTDPLPTAGVPIAFGDPTFSGTAHLLTASATGLDLWRGPTCRPGAMHWSGTRGDHWRTGTLRADGTMLGPT